MTYLFIFLFDKILINFSQTLVNLTGKNPKVTIKKERRGSKIMILYTQALL